MKFRRVVYTSFNAAAIAKVVPDKENARMFAQKDNVRQKPIPVRRRYGFRTGVVFVLYIVKNYDLRASVLVVQATNTGSLAVCFDPDINNLAELVPHINRKDLRVFLVNLHKIVLQQRIAFVFADNIL